MLKVCVFRYLFWLVLVVVFIAGATRISIFGLGYLTACFYFLLFGTALLRRPLKARLVLWDCLILYNVTVIIAKNLLSVRLRGVGRPGAPEPFVVGETLQETCRIGSHSQACFLSFSRHRIQTAGLSPFLLSPA